MKILNVKTWIFEFSNVISLHFVIFLVNYFRIIQMCERLSQISWFLSHLTQISSFIFTFQRHLETNSSFIRHWISDFEFYGGTGTGTGTGILFGIWNLSSDRNLSSDSNWNRDWNGIVIWVEMSGSGSGTFRFRFRNRSCYDCKKNPCNFPNFSEPFLTHP